MLKFSPSQLKILISNLNNNKKKLYSLLEGAIRLKQQAHMSFKACSIDYSLSLSKIHYNNKKMTSSINYYNNISSKLFL